MSIEILNLTAEVALLLGTDAALLDVFDEGAVGYCCTVCGRPADLADEQPTSVVLLVDRGGTTRSLVRLAHAWCAEPGVRVMHDPTVVDIPANWPAVAWLRPSPADPGAVLLLGPRMGTLGGTAPAVADRLTAAWRERGFTSLHDPHAPISDLDGLTVHLGTGGAVSVWHRHGRALWDGTIVPPLGWADAARRNGRVGVVVAAGLRLDFRDRDHLADLHHATRDGYAVAGTAHLLPDAD
jgi:hypothetical protein